MEAVGAVQPASPKPALTGPHVQKQWDEHLEGICPQRP